jgi:hypothetical protein
MSGGSRKQPCSVRIPLRLPESVSMTDVAQTVLTKPCIKATGRPNNQGYHYARCGERRMSIGKHVLACEQAHGPRPSHRHQASHKCHNRWCVEPTHLEWLTFEEHRAVTIKSKTRRTFPRDMKIEAVQRHLIGGENLTEIGRSLGLPSNRVFYWLEESLRKGWVNRDGTLPDLDPQPAYAMQDGGTLIEAHA